MHTDTALVRLDAAPGDPLSPTSTPIYQTATFVQPPGGAVGPYDYSRSGNPTRDVLAAQLARLEDARSALVYGSGMAALSAVGGLLGPGERLLAGSDLYGGSYRLLERILSPRGVRVDYVDSTDLPAVARALETPTRLLLIESPTNPLQHVSDIAALATLARRAGAWLAVDGTLLSPYLQRPLAHGADLVVHSATKALCGHGDVTAGVVATRDDALAETLAFRQNAEGTALGPFDSWLLLRGLKTLAVRVERQQSTALRLAGWLAERPEVRRVHHAGLAAHPGHALLRRQASGGGSVISFETGCRATSERLLDALGLFSRSVSFGSVSSLASLPCRMSHAAIPAAVRAARGLPEDLIRLSIGLEDAGDLEGDLAQALLAARRPEQLVGATSRPRGIGSSDKSAAEDAETRRRGPKRAAKSRCEPQRR